MDLMLNAAAGESPSDLAGTPRRSPSATASSAARSAPLHVVFSSRRSTWVRSASTNSRLTTSASAAGSTRPS
eukprot:4483953-Prymnesium_polylepis.1